MKKSARIYKLDHRIFIHANKKTVTTLPIFSQPLFEFSIETEKSILGMALRKCLEAWTEGHPQPSREELKKVNDPLIELAGEKNSKSFFSKVIDIPVKLNEDVISFYPTINKGWEAGFIPANSGPIECNHFSKLQDETLGELILEALSKSFDKPEENSHPA